MIKVRKLAKKAFFHYYPANSQDYFKEYAWILKIWKKENLRVQTDK
jgi:hypothetical protein